MGWDLPVVHHDRRLLRGLRRRRVARHQRLTSPCPGPHLPHLLREQPRRRGDGKHLELPRHHAVRAPGGVGGLARGHPADPAVSVVELPRQVRGRGVIAHVSGIPLEEALPAVIVAAPPLLARLRMWRRKKALDRGAGTDDRAHLPCAPAQRVFDAFTSEEVMRRWWHAGARLGDARGRASTCASAVGSAS